MSDEFVSSLYGDNPPNSQEDMDPPPANPQVEKNLFRSTENVVLNKVLGYKIHGQKHTFLEDY